MKATFFMLLIFVLPTMAHNAEAQNAVIKLHSAKLSVNELITAIEEQTDLLVLYRSKDVDTDRRIEVQNKSDKVSALLNFAFENTDIRYEIDNKYILLAKKNDANPQGLLQEQKRVTGTVTDTNGEALIGASVSIKGTKLGIATDLDGKFSLNVPNNAVLTISFLGYVPQEIAVGNQTQINVTLQEDSRILSEVVVTALGIKREEKALGYAVQTIKSEELTRVKGVDMSTSLTGKVAGLTVYNSSEFQDDAHANILRLRGETALLVIDGFPSSHTNLRDLAADDIEDITVLKGPTASALYGSRGGNGAIMVTTKRGNKEEGVSVSFNSNDMFNAGFLILPERQSSYSAGQGGKFDVEDYVWGQKLDIGLTAPQYDPYTYTIYDQPLVSKGKDNFKNFLETGLTTNNNIAVTYSGKLGSFRTSINHVYQKGYYPNIKANRYNFDIAGNINIGKFKLDASVNYSHRIVPNILTAAGSTQNSPIYNLISWTGADWDVRDYKNYWKPGQEGIEQNWSNSYYNNPWFNMYEWTKSQDEGRYNAQFNTSYEFTDWLTASARLGSDRYQINLEEKKPEAYRIGHGDSKPIDYRGGNYKVESKSGYSVNGEALLMADKTFDVWHVDGFVGASIYYTNAEASLIQTGDRNHLSVPNFYSLLASGAALSAERNLTREQRNAVFGKVGISWKSALFADVTGRNDWTSTLAEGERSYFYPSVAGSAVLTEFLPKFDWLSFWKVRASWTQTKLPAKIYEINQVYTITNIWNQQKGAAYPTSMRPGGLKPKTTEGIEFGTAANFLDNRLRLDFTYFRKRYYNNQISAQLSSASGFTGALVNTQEEYLRKGFEITLAGDVIRTKDFNWTSTVNWSNGKYSYHKLDPEYSSKDYWIHTNALVNVFSESDWLRVPETGELIIGTNGLPVAARYNSRFSKEPDWTWGFNNEFTYKNFNLNISIDGRVGGHAKNSIYRSMWVNGTNPDSDNAYRYDEVVNGNKSYIAPGVKVVSGTVEYNADQTIKSDNRVYAPNDIGVSYESYSRSYWGRNATSVFDMTFLKVREISLGYTLPKNIAQKVKLKNVQLALTAQNVFLWSKEFKYEDPDSDYDTLPDWFISPSERLIGFNVKFDF